MSRFTTLVDALPGVLPFIAPERLERCRGQPLKLRLGANESTFGVADGVPEAMALERIAWYGDPESLELRDERSPAATADYPRMFRWAPDH